MTAPVLDADTAVTHGLVCAHHHLYSTLARGMPAPPRTPTSFIDVLEQVWWRLDAALDTDTIYWSAALGAAEAALSGTTAIIDHHESPSAIEGSLDALFAGCDLVGVRTSLCYGVTDRWSDDGTLHAAVATDAPMTRAAREGLDECERHLTAGRRGMVGVHAAFTCGDETLQAAADLATRLGTGVHIHVAEGPDDADAGRRLSSLATPEWLLVHCVHLTEELEGTIVHNPRSNMNNSVGYARPALRPNRVVLGTDGIGADMLEEARLAHARHREDDLSASPEESWGWLLAGTELFPEVRDDVVTWSEAGALDPWRSAYTTGLRAVDVTIAERPVVRNGRIVSCDIDEIRAKAAEAANRLHSRL